jgi:glycosyltransferase involved in cell wall biosynthesis
MKFILMHQTIVPGDAIGHDIAGMHNSLVRRGHSCLVFGEYVNAPGVNVCDRDTAELLLRDPGAIAIYHHSILWRLGEAMLAAARASIVFKYHNVTPPNYFVHSPAAWTKCAGGREQTYRFAYTFPEAAWLSDSRYNLAELGLDEAVPHIVTPPFMGTAMDDGEGPDGELLKALIEERRSQLLFVSRFAPNKGHMLLVDVLESYIAEFGADAVLYVIGALDDHNQPYFSSVMAKARRAGIADRFIYLGTVPQRKLLAYFLGCDAYVSCSEHEGFCVPIVEAQSSCLPVVARAAGAVPETAGPGQLLFHEDPRDYARALDRLRRDADFRHEIAAAGRRNYLSRFSDAATESRFVAALSEVLNAPV